jgi:hypothetical protein
MRPVNRLVWGVSGLATAAALAVPGTWLMTGHGFGPGDAGGPISVNAVPTAALPKPTVGLTVDSCNAPVRVVAQQVKQVQVTEPGMYSKGMGAAPTVEWSTSDGQLIVGDPTCDSPFQPSQYTVAVPDGVPVTVDSQGGDVMVSGTAGATVDSGNGSVVALGINGPLTVSTGGGDLSVHDLTGTLYADTSNGSVWATGVTARAATVITGGGDASLRFTTAPDTVVVSTDNGSASLFVPGGPYSVTDSTDGGSSFLRIPVSPSARRTINAATGGGNLVVAP